MDKVLLKDTLGEQYEEIASKFGLVDAWQGECSIHSFTRISRLFREKKDEELSNALLAGTIYNSKGDLALTEEAASKLPATAGHKLTAVAMQIIVDVNEESIKNQKKS